MEINLLDPAGYLHGQPYEQFAWLRENDPVHWHEEPNGPGFWALTRYADIRTMEKDWKTFGNEPTIMISDDGTIGDDTHHSVIFTDPPRHTEHRALLSEEFNALRVRKMWPQMRVLADEILDEVSAAGSCDLASDIAGKLASYAIADVMGAPREDVYNMYLLSDIVNSARSLTDGPAHDAMMEVFGIAQGAWKERQDNPGEGMLSRISKGSIGGCPMDEMQFSIDFMVLLNAGGDTTRNVLSGGLEALFAHPDQQEQLWNDPSLVPSAVEEMIRWVTPIVYQRRTAKADAQLGGKEIKAGQKVVSFYGAANRDESVFTEPEKFDITRKPNPQIAFGAGPHFCLGSHLARLELQVMLTAIVERISDLRPNGSTEWVRNDLDMVPPVVGPKSMPVTFTPSAPVLVKA
jgi:cytochrome P450